MNEPDTESRNEDERAVEVVAKTFGDLLVSSGSVVISAVRGLFGGLEKTAGWTARSVEEIASEDSAVRQPLAGAYLLGFSALTFAMVAGAALASSNAAMLQMLASGGLRILWAAGILLAYERLLRPLPAQHYPVKRALALSMTIFALALNGPSALFLTVVWALFTAYRLGRIGFSRSVGWKFVIMSVAALAATVVLQWVGQYVLILAMLALG